MSKKATNLLNLCRRNIHICSKEVKNSAYNMIVRPHLEYASTCWNPYTKRNIDKLEAVQRRAARFVLNFYDYHPTADLSGKIQKTLQWDSLQHSRAVSDLCIFHKLRNNLAIPPILVPSVKHSCHYNHIQSLHSDAFRYQFFARGVRLWNIIPYHLTTKPSLESFRTATFQWISPLQWYKHINVIILFVCFHFSNLDENRFQNVNIYMLIIYDIVLNMLIVLVFKVNVPCVHVCVCIIIFKC